MASPNVLQPLAQDVGIVIVDHGSRFPAANAMLNDVAALYKRMSGAAIVEPAHMELAEPTIAEAFARCVAQGALTVAVIPYFLSPGRHSQQDIPRMVAEAAAAHPDIAHVVAEPLGVSPLLTTLMHERLAAALDTLR